MFIQRGLQQKETVKLKECLEAQTAKTQKRNCGLLHWDKRGILCQDLRRTTTVYRKPTAPGHWTLLHLPSLSSQHSKSVSEGRQKQTQQQPLTFSCCPKHKFSLNLCYFHFQKHHHTTCHLPDFRNPSSASGEAETSEASEEDRTTTSGKSEDPPGT